MNEREHIYYFDYLRVFACLNVIFMHTAAESLRWSITPNWYITNAYTSLAFTAVPLFFMMSGYLLMTSQKTADVSILLKKRLPRLVVPLIFWTVLSIIWTLYIDQQLTLSSFMNALIDSTHEPAMTHMWYMYTLITMYVISPFLFAYIHNLSRSGHILAFSLIVLILVQTMLRIILPTSLGRFFHWGTLDDLHLLGGHLCSFLLGYYLGTSKKKVSNRLLIGISVTCFSIIAVGTWFLTKESGSFDASFQSQNKGFEILLASCIFLLAKQNLNKTKPWLYTFIKPFATLSLPIYLCHLLVLRVLVNWGMSRSCLIEIVGATLVITFSCFMLAKTTASIKPLCFLANGLPYQDACSTANWQYTFRWIKHLISKKG